MLLLASVILLFVISPPRLTLLRLNQFKPYDILLEQENPALFRSRIYVTESDGKLSSAIFWRDGIRWNYLADLQASPELTMIDAGFPVIENGNPDIVHYCLIAGTEEKLYHQIEQYAPVHDLTYDNLQTTIVNSSQGELFVAWCTSKADNFSSQDLAWLVFN